MFFFLILELTSNELHHCLDYLSTCLASSRTPNEESASLSSYCLKKDQFFGNVATSSPSKNSLVFQGGVGWRFGGSVTVFLSFCSALPFGLEVLAEVSSHQTCLAVNLFITCTGFFSLMPLAMFCVFFNPSAFLSSFMFRCFLSLFVFPWAQNGRCTSHY